MTPQRKFVLTKLAAGDYLLPSNGGKTLWRINLYVEGPSTGIDEWERDRDVWGLWHWDKAVVPGSFVDTEDWSRWHFHSGPHMKRAEAIEEALKAGELHA